MTTALAAIPIPLERDPSNNIYLVVREGTTLPTETDIDQGPKDNIPYSTPSDPTQHRMLNSSQVAVIWYDGQERIYGIANDFGIVRVILGSQETEPTNAKVGSISLSLAASSDNNNRGWLYYVAGDSSPYVVQYDIVNRNSKAIVTENVRSGTNIAAVYGDDKSQVVFQVKQDGPTAQLSRYDTHKEDPPELIPHTEDADQQTPLAICKCHDRALIHICYKSTSKNNKVRRIAWSFDHGYSTEVTLDQENDIHVLSNIAASPDDKGAHVIFRNVSSSARNTLTHAFDPWWNET